MNFKQQQLHFYFSAKQAEIEKTRAVYFHKEVYVEPNECYIPATKTRRFYTECHASPLETHKKRFSDSVYLGVGRIVSINGKEVI